jgi:hypothetical protein
MALSPLARIRCPVSVDFHSVMDGCANIHSTGRIESNNIMAHRLEPDFQHVQDLSVVGLPGSDIRCNSSRSLRGMLHPVLHRHSSPDVKVFAQNILSGMMVVLD